MGRRDEIALDSAWSSEARRREREVPAAREAGIKSERLRLADALGVEVETIQQIGITDGGGALTAESREAMEKVSAAILTITNTPG